MRYPEGTMEQQINLNRVEIFLQMVESGSITKAAQVLRVAKSKLSRDLALLERELGVQLIYRTTREFRLTEPGQRFFEKANKSLSAMQEAISEVSKQSDEIAGVIRFTAPEDIGSYVMSRVANDFKILHPKIIFEMNFSNEILNLVKDRIDIAIRMGRLSDSSMTLRKAGQVDMILVASPKYLDSLKSIPSIQDLEKCRSVCFIADEEKPQWTLVSVKEKKIIKLKSDIICNNYVALKEMVILGNGIGLLPRFFCEDAIAKGDLVHILKAWRNEGSAIQVVLPEQKEIPQKIRSFMDFTVKKLLLQFG